MLINPVFFSVRNDWGLCGTGHAWDRKKYDSESAADEQDKQNRNKYVFHEKICISSVTTMASDNYKYILDYSQVVNFKNITNNMNNCNSGGNIFIFA